MKNLQERNSAILTDVLLTNSSLNKQATHWSTRTEQVGQKQDY